jgi:hypothetical protein
MITGEIKSKVDRIWDTLWSGGISNPLTIIEQLTYLLFIKRLDEIHTLKENKANRLKKPIEEPIFTPQQESLRWSRFKETSPEEMFTTVRDHAFPFIKTLGQSASGDGGKPGRYRRFDTLFGARRFDFGPTALYGALQRTNIISPGLRLEGAPDNRTDVMASYRALWLENPRDAFATTSVRAASGGAGRFAGHQAEVRLRHWLVPGLLQAETGGAMLFKRGVLKTAPNAPGTGDSVYGYFDLTLTL